jgi:TrmH family RNA methyltransferase
VLSLQRGGTVAAERSGELTVAEGFWANEVVRDTGVRVVSFLWCPDALRGPEAVALARELSARAEQSFEVSAKTLDRITERDKPDGLLSVVELPHWQPQDLQLGERALVLVSDGIEQPGNLGTLIRTLDACGADALVLTSTRTRRSSIKTFRASHGAVLRIPSVSFDSPELAANWLEGQGFGIYLADTDGAARYCDVRYAARTAIVMGNERFGISESWYRPAAAKVFIPMLGDADSLNVSISAAVLLYEARSQLSDWR